MGWSLGWQFNVQMLVPAQQRKYSEEHQEAPYIEVYSSKAGSFFAFFLLAMLCCRGAGESGGAGQAV